MEKVVIHNETIKVNNHASVERKEKTYNGVGTRTEENPNYEKASLGSNK